MAKHPYYNIQVSLFANLSLHLTWSFFNHPIKSNMLSTIRLFFIVEGRRTKTRNIYYVRNSTFHISFNIPNTSSACVSSWVSRTILKNCLDIQGNLYPSLPSKIKLQQHWKVVQRSLFVHINMKYLNSKYT